MSHETADPTAVLPDDHWRPTYEDIHIMIRQESLKVREEFEPDLMVAIGGGGFFPARVLRTFLRKQDKHNPGKLRNVPIQAIGLSLYEETEGSAGDKIGTEVVRTQWLDVTNSQMSSNSRDNAGGLLGKNILIVDEVDESRMTLHYAYRELLKDVHKALESYSEEERASMRPTRFAIFVVHNKLGPKRAELPIIESAAEEKIEGGVSTGVYYYAAETMPPVWINYPWEETDIFEHNRLSQLAKQLGVGQPPRT